MYDELNELIVGREPVQRHLESAQRILDRKSLEEAIIKQRIRRILESLDGIEFMEKIEEEDFSGKRTYIVFGVRMFASSSGIDPKTGEMEESFKEVMPEEAVNSVCSLRHPYGSSAR